MKKYVLQPILLSMILLSCTPKFPVELGRGFKLDYVNNHDIGILDSLNDVIVGPCVTSYNLYSTYIIVEQKPRDVILHDSDYQKKNFDEIQKIFKESP